MWALLPLKDFVNAKQRLSSVLASHERRHLFHSMVEDVLDVLAGHPALEQTVIVSDDPAAEQLAVRYGVQYWAESSLAVPATKAGLSAVVDAAAKKLVQQGVDAMVVVHGDLPLLAADDIQQLLNRHALLTAPAITIAPDTMEEGSNCVVSTPPDAIAFQYGAGSFGKHMAVAEAKAVAANSIPLATAACDIDQPIDLKQLSAGKNVSRHTLRYLHDSGIAERLQAAVSDNVVIDSGNTLAVNTPSDTVFERVLAEALVGELPDNESALSLADPLFSNEIHTEQLMAVASQLRDQGFRNVITYSRKVFIPLTHLCRDVCHYCTFAQTPKKIQSPYMSVEAVLASVRAAVKQGCKEALFTLGEKPELRYRAARHALQAMGFESTLHYAAHVASIVFEETGVLPHINAGCMSSDEIAMLRPVSASMGIMLESVSSRLGEKGMPHYGSPDKEPALRLQTIARAGKARVPFTSGILIGIGETRRERIESLLALREQSVDYGHLQEIIIQNFRAKAQTKMAQAPEPDLNELLWTIAVARIIFGPTMSIQAPPNLSPGVLAKIISAGINDWGGVSPITPDFVNPEAPGHSWISWQGKPVRRVNICMSV